MSEYNKELVEKVIKGMMKFRKFHHPKLSDDISRMEGSIIFWLVKSEKWKINQSMYQNLQKDCMCQCSLFQEH